jgi:hypothetical protein
MGFFFSSPSILRQPCMNTWVRKNECAPPHTHQEKPRARYRSSVPSYNAPGMSTWRRPVPFLILSFCFLCLKFISKRSSCLWPSPSLSSSISPLVGNSTRDGPVGPDTGSHVAGTSGKVASRRAGCHGNDRVLVSLEHELRVTRARVPELHAAILRTRENPIAVGRQSNAENEVLRTSASLSFPVQSCI